VSEQICPNCNNPYETGDEVCRTCGFILPVTSQIITPGEILQTRYEIQEMVHSGGMGYVYLATDKRLYDRLCIVKQVKESIKSDAHRKKLEEEALRMSKLNHPNVAMILDHFTDGGYYFLVVERIYGKTLSEVFKERRGHLAENEVVSWAISICDVVSYLHKEGIVHRDISPDNIMLTGEGSIKFIDFGTLREFRYIAPGGTVGIGKYGYTPPEQWQGKPELRSDIFALGATIYYLLTGFLPLSREYVTRQAPQKEDFNATFPPIRTKNTNVSAQLEAVLQKALQLDVNDRHSSAAEFGEDLRNLERMEVKKVEVKKIPILSLETRHLNFANVKFGATVTKPLILRNTGTDKLTGKLTTNQPWLKVSPSSINLKSGQWNGKVTIDMRRLPPGFYGAGEINITTNGGQAKVTVDLSIAAEARPKEVGAKPKPISKPKARMPLRWAVISLGIILFLIAGGGGVYFTFGHLFIPSPTLAIQDVSASDITGTGAVLTWTTDKPANSQAEYGYTADCGLASALDEELVTSHRVELTGLQSNTICYFRVMSKGAGGKEAMSDTGQLTTLPTGAQPAPTPESPPPAPTPPAAAELSFKAKTYTNDEYGFSLQYPSDWVERPELLTTEYHVAAFSVTAFIPGVVIAHFDTVEPISNDWIAQSFKDMGNANFKIKSDLKEITLADGTKATTYEAEYISATGYDVRSFNMDADKGDKRIRLIIFTIEAFADYDEALFSEIAHTLTFKGTGAPSAPPAPQPTPAPPPAQKPAEQPPPAELSFEAKTYTNGKYGFSLQYPSDWVERPELLRKDAVAAFGVSAYVPGVIIQVFDADKPISVDWFISSYEAQANSSVRVVSPLTETTLADGTKATTYKVKYISATSGGYEVVSYGLDADKGDKRIRIVVFTIEGFEPYDEALSSEIAHTLRFTQ